MNLSLSTIRSHMHPLVWALVAMLVVLPICQHNWEAVLCIESDGNINVESPHTGVQTLLAASHVSKTQTKRSITAKVRPGGPIHGIDCIDIPFQSTATDTHTGALTSAAPQFDVILPAALSILFPPVATDQPSPSSFFAEAQSAPAFSQSNLPSLQTIVLLI